MAEIVTGFADADLAICVTPSRNRALTGSEFGAMTFLEIGNVVTVPAFGVEEDMQTRDVVKGLGYHFKGAKRGIQSEIVVGRDTTDTGYLALVAASKTSAWYPMRIIVKDSPNPATTTNTVEYALVLIGRGSRASGGPNDDAGLETFSIAIQSDPVSVAPAAIPGD
jgi:hypothetical protein